MNKGYKQGYKQGYMNSFPSERRGNLNQTGYTKHTNFFIVLPCTWACFEVVTYRLYRPVIKKIKNKCSHSQTKMTVGQLAFPRSHIHSGPPFSWAGSYWKSRFFRTWFSSTNASNFCCSSIMSRRIA